jgi:hypothetical protein
MNFGPPDTSALLGSGVGVGVAAGVGLDSAFGVAAGSSPAGAWMTVVGGSGGGVAGVGEAAGVCAWRAIGPSAIAAAIQNALGGDFSRRENSFTLSALNEWPIKVKHF